MAVLQPLYITSGKYTAGTDRKLLAALVDSETSGLRTAGIFGPTSRMKVTGSSLTLTIQPGICVIPDSSSPNADAPGVYLCSIDTSAETLAIPAATSGTRTDLIYASASETQYNITNKVASGGTATLTTSTAHTFVVGQTVQIVGVDDIFDGTYIITATNSPTNTTFSYVRTGTVTSAVVVPTIEYAGATYNIASYYLTSNIVYITTVGNTTIPTEKLITIKGVSSLIDGTYQTIGASTGGTTGVTFAKIASDSGSVGAQNIFWNGTTWSSYSNSAKAGVPFAIKIASGTTTLPAGSNLSLAQVTVSTSAITTVVDTRQFIAAAGGVRVWDSSSNPTGPTGAQGRLRFNAATGATGQKLEIYNSISGSYAPLYNHASGHHDTVATDASTAAIHHTLGTGANQAAQGNHGHTTVNGKTFFIQPVASGTPTALTAGDVWISY
jgi:hypothetical protein